MNFNGGKTPSKISNLIGYYLRIMYIKQTGPMYKKSVCSPCSEAVDVLGVKGDCHMAPSSWLCCWSLAELNRRSNEIPPVMITLMDCGQSP